MVKSQIYMATLKFDMTDPETKATVESWAPNTEYTVVTGETPTGIVQTVDEEVEPAEPAAAPGPAAVRAAMSSAPASVPR